MLVNERSDHFTARDAMQHERGWLTSPWIYAVCVTLAGLGAVLAYRPDLQPLVGDRAFFANLEYRFPLIDLIATPVFAIQGVRGVVFADVGGAWFGDVQDFDFYNEDESRLEDGLAAYGWGVTVQFLGLELNWDLARRTDFKDAEDYRTTFWIGTRF